MVFIGKKICLDPQDWESKSEADFLEKFKGVENVPTLKRAFANLPKPKKKVKTKKVNAKNGSVPISG